MEAFCRCHSCGTEVNADTRRCPNCYVALGAATRAPSPLRAAPSPALGSDQASSAPAQVPPTTTKVAQGTLIAVSTDGASVTDVARFTEHRDIAAAAEVRSRSDAGSPSDVRSPSVVRCPACETTVLPVTGWCSYCMEPLPIDGSSSDASTLAEWDFEDFEMELPDETPSAQVIVGPWPDQPHQPHQLDQPVQYVEPVRLDQPVQPVQPVQPAEPEPDQSNVVTLASWRQRALAALIDAAVFLPAAIALVFSTTIGLVLLVAAVAVTAWQVCHLQGRSGQTIGKNRVGIFVVGEASLAPIGVRRSGLRQLAHGIDAALFGLGYLWPLWDTKRQTFADQLFSTIVLSD